MDDTNHAKRALHRFIAVAWDSRRLKALNEMATTDLGICPSGLLAIIDDSVESA